MAAIVAQLLEQKNLERVCRLCLADATEVGDLLPIFPIRGGKISNPSAITNRIQQCTSLMIDPSMKGPRWICELCHVRLEDWYAFREQCLGSDEYLRFNMRQWIDNEAANKTPEEQEPSMVHDGRAESHSTPSTEQPNPRGSSSLAHRRKSVFEWTVPDARGDQRVIVELLGDEETTNGNGTHNTLSNGGHPAIETPPMEETAIVDQTVPPPAKETVMASPGLDWSLEFRARVNSQMHILAGAPRPYECKICRSRFKRRNNLRRHIRANHADEIIVGESPAEEFYALRPPTLDKQQLRQQQEQHQQQHELHVQSNEAAEPNAFAGDNASDMNSQSLQQQQQQPVYQCTICPRSFKMPAHLAVHRKAHLQKDLRAKEAAALDHQRQQQQHESQMMIPPVRTFGRKSDIEPCAIIQLSDDDDDDDDVVVNASQGSTATGGGETEEQNGIYATANGTTNGYQDDEQADDGFDEDEGSLKESSLEPSSLAIVELGADDDETEVIIPPDVDPWKMKKPDRQRATLPVSSSSSSSPPPAPLLPRSRPGPLSSKRRHTTTGGDETEQLSASSGTPGMHQSAVPPSSKRSATSTTPLMHAGPIPYRCHFCQETFPQEELLRLHLKTHGNNAPAPFRCGWCRKGFRYRQNYMIHVEKQTCRTQSTGTAAASTVELLNGGTGGGGGAASTVVPRLVAKKRAW
ncbi:uncharacterized protein LOC126578871 [Anopheles aquasalis]|uniref:uncharacterized protein LOC126578871 n=1 Tax=Anopheles aquasalis TaxID=42839 RepID=UPI00215A8585|nr:uncharacterized protein LOC126578871 [Anopheles aquasalis]